MIRDLFTLTLRSAEHTAKLASACVPRLKEGDIIGLVGDVGAGKSFFSRALIQSAQQAAGQSVEDVPSPTFTLVQTYQAGALEIWHADLYRMNDPMEAVEIGLDEAFEAALCLVEWPDRFGPEWPTQRALTLRFEALDDETRRVSASGSHIWQDRLTPIIEEFQNVT